MCLVVCFFLYTYFPVILSWILYRRATVLGRPEKLPDVCYSWWVLSSLAIIRRLHWIDKVMKKFLDILTITFFFYKRENFYRDAQKL